MFSLKTPLYYLFFWGGGWSGGGETKSSKFGRLKLVLLSAECCKILDIVKDLATLLSTMLSGNLLITGNVLVPMTISFLLNVKKVYI